MSSMTAKASVPRGDRLTCAPGAAEAAKKIRCRAMKSRQLASMQGSTLAMTRTLSRIAQRVPAPREQRQRIGGEGAEVVDERRLRDRRLGDGAQADESLEPRRGHYLRVGDVLEATRRALQCVLFGKLEAPRGKLGHHLPERLRRPGRRAAEPRQLMGLGAMESGGEEASLRRKMKIEDAGVVLGPGPGHGDARVGLVRVLVLGEAHVAVDAENRRLAVAFDRNLRPGEASRRLLDQVAHRRLDRGLISSAVLFEPFPRLVERQRLEERQRLRPESLKRHETPPLVESNGGGHETSRSPAAGARAGTMVIADHLTRSMSDGQAGWNRERQTR